jgi:hypothetical protein
MKEKKDRRRDNSGRYEYWMQSLDGGRSDYLQPGWLVAH